MIVTRLELISGSRVKVSLDEDFAFVLYKGEVRLYQIREGEEIPQTTWDEIREKVLKKRARLRCMNLLKDRDYTANQLSLKLLRGGYPNEIAEDALEYVKSYGYVDDGRYARSYISNQREKKSRRRIEEDLRSRGIESEVIREAFLEQESLGETPDEEALAYKWLDKKKFDKQTADIKEIRKMSAFLYRKGIGTETIRRVLETR